MSKFVLLFDHYTNRFTLKTIMQYAKLETSNSTHGKAYGQTRRCNSLV